MSVLSKTNYLIPVGKDDEARMGSINYTFDPYSIKWSVPETITQKMNYLDVGCGPGILTIGIAKSLGQNGRVVALDASEEQIAVAKKNGQEQNVDVEWKVGNVYDLSQYKEQFDVVHCRFVLVHLKNPLEAIEQMALALKPGGLLIMEEMTANSYTWTPIETKALIFSRWMVKLQYLLQRSDITVGARLGRMIRDLGFQYVEEAKPDPIAATPEGKALFPLAVKAFSLKLPRLLNYIFSKAINFWIESLRSVQYNDAYSVKFHTFIQVRGIKPK